MSVIPVGRVSQMVSVFGSQSQSQSQLLGVSSKKITKEDELAEADGGGSERRKQK